MIKHNNRGGDQRGKTLRGAIVEQQRDTSSLFHHLAPTGPWKCLSQLKVPKVSEGKRSILQ